MVKKCVGDLAGLRRRGVEERKGRSWKVVGRGTAG